MNKIIHCCYILLVLLGCKTKPSQQQQVLAIREMGELATTSFVVTKMVKANDNLTWYKIGDRKILMSCEATIKAGVDLTQLQPGDVDIDGKSISLYLPAPKLIAFNIPPDKIKVEHQSIALLRSDFTSAERDDLLVQAENQIKKSLVSMGVFETTQKNTEQLLQPFLQQMGFEEVHIYFGTKAPDQNDAKN